MIFVVTEKVTPDSKVHGANMGPIWGRQDPGGPHVGLMNFAVCVTFHSWFEAYHPAANYAWQY